MAALPYMATENRLANFAIGIWRDIEGPPSSNMTTMAWLIYQSWLSKNNFWFTRADHLRAICFLQKTLLD